jgi:CelD/BcsL family acetyltransferase involved in cellulose biosynthesis
MDESCEWVVDRPRFLALAADWDALAERERHPFSLQAWMLPWWDAFGGGSQLRVLVVWRGGELVAGIALAARGRTWRSLANEHSPLFAPLAADRQALATLATAVVAAAPAQLVLEVLPAGGEALAAFEAACRAARRPFHVAPHIVSPFSGLEGGFAGFSERASRKAIKNVGRRRRRLEREHEVLMRPLSVSPERREAVTRFFRLEQSGWKGERGTAIALLPDVERFYREVAETFAARDSLRLSELWVDGTPAASEFVLVHARSIFLLKVGMDESRRELAPGVVLLLAGIEAAAEEGFETYEFLGDVTDLKRRLATGERRHVVMRSYDPAVAPLFAYAYRRWVRPRAKAAREAARAALANRQAHRR